MKCPYCHNPLAANIAECPACRLTFPRTQTLLGATPRIQPGVSDSTGALDSKDQASLKARIAKIQKRFPQAVIQIVLYEFPAEHPFSLHAFWIFNAGSFSGIASRGKDNHAILLAIDPTRGEAAIVPGYGLEALLSPKALDHLLELATPAWAANHWAQGIERVLDGLDSLLESIASPITAAPRVSGEY